MDELPPMAELNRHETLTLIQIANGWDGAADISETDVTRLQTLGLVEQRAMSIGLTAIGRHAIVRLRRA
jgi:hypothetical protein